MFGPHGNGALVVRDLFTGADSTLLQNHTAERGGPWMRLWTTYSLIIQGNRVRPSGGSTGHRYAIRSSWPILGLDIRARFYTITAGDFATIGLIMVRMNDADGPSFGNEWAWDVSNGELNWHFGTGDGWPRAFVSGSWMRMCCDHRGRFWLAVAGNSDMPVWEWYVRGGTLRSGRSGGAAAPHLIWQRHDRIWTPLVHPGLMIQRWGTGYYEADSYEVYSYPPLARPLAYRKRTGLWMPKRTVIGR